MSPHEPLSSPVRARVVALRDGRRLAWVVGVLGGLDALYVLGTLRLHELPALFGSRYWTVTFVLAAWLVAPLLSFRPRPKGVELRVVAGELRAGRVSLPLHGLVGRVAKVRRGVSVALVSGAQGVFLEMDREVDARRLLERLGLPADLARSSRPALPLPVPGLVRARRASAAAGLVAAVLYGVLVGTLDQGFMKPYLAIPALVLGGLACALFVAEPHVRRWRRVGEAKAVPAGSARVEAHFRAHEADASRDEARAMGDADAGADALPPRLEALARGDEPASTWLRRVDRLGEGADAYRGASYTAEELAALTSDSNADVSARVGAARLLRTRHGRSETEVVAMTGPALEPRVRVAVLSPEAAARELEQAEPLFAFEDATAEPSERRRG